MEKYEEGIKILEENMKLDRSTDNSVQYFLGKVDSRKFYKKHGVDRKTLTSVAEANNKLVNSIIAVSANKLEENDDKETVITKVRTDIGQFVGRVSKKVRKSRNPRTEEPVTIYGSTTIQCDVKPLIDKELLSTVKEKIKKMITDED